MNHKTQTPSRSGSARKQMALYARVSTQEQTKGQYPSCDSQIEELEAFCTSKGWEIFERIQDPGHRAGTLQRPGLSHLRWLVETKQIDGVICTWYNRLIGSRDFYVLDKELKAHDVELITIHDPADRYSAAGRLFESMLVTIKTFENEQIGEKVRTKLRMRAEKGLWNGGLVSFGFKCNPQTQILTPDPDKAPLVQQMFEVYTDTQSDFAVRDWLKAHGIPAPNGRDEWTAGSIRDLLMNRRYIAEVEINRTNKSREGLPDFEAYRIIPMPYAPIVSRELFDLAQAVRREKAEKSPGRTGKGKGQAYSRNQCQRIYPLQGILVCGICSHAMSPHYVYHRPNPEKGRRTGSYIYHYLCAQKMKYRGGCDHSNRVLAKVPEGWILDKIAELVNFGNILEDALQVAWAKTEQALQPTKETLALCRKALEENQRKIDELLDTASNARGALLELFTEKANNLKMDRERLRIEQRRLSEALLPLNHHFDPDEYREVLGDFPLLFENMLPQEMQRLLRLIVRRMEWMPDGCHRVQYKLPTFSGGPPDNKNTGSRLPSRGQPNRTFSTNQSSRRSTWVPRLDVGSG